MEKRELQAHYNNLTNLIHQILIETKGLEYEDFRKNELLKERIFAQLQELGEASREIMDVTNEYEDDRGMVENLQAFRNARFNQESETGLNSVWGIIQQDLPEMEEIFYRKIKMEE